MNSPTPPRRSTTVLLACLIGATAGCSEVDPTRRAAPAPPRESDESASASSSTGGGTEPEGNAETVPSTPCMRPAASAVRVYADTAPPLTSLTRLGGRWMANGESGFVLFDDDGGNADATPTVLGPNLSATAASGATGGIAATSEAIQYQRIAEHGEMMGVPAGVATIKPVALTLAEDVESTIVWGTNSKLEARVMSESGGFATEVFTLTYGAFSSYLFLGSAARNGEVGVVWTGDAMLGFHDSYFLAMNATGALGERNTLYTTEEAHSLAQVAATEDGYAVLFTGPPPAFRPVVLTVDANGTVTHGPLEMVDAQFGYGVAAHGATIAVVVGRETGEPQMRTFNLELEPQADWVCLGADHDQVLTPAIAAHDTGYAVLHTDGDGHVWLHKTDELGSGRP